MDGLSQSLPRTQTIRRWIQSRESVEPGYEGGAGESEGGRAEGRQGF